MEQFPFLIFQQSSFEFFIVQVQEFAFLTLSEIQVSYFCFLSTYFNDQYPYLDNSDTAGYEVWRILKDRLPIITYTVSGW